jgi:hypothetical protein
LIRFVPLLSSATVGMVDHHNNTDDHAVRGPHGTLAPVLPVLPPLGKEYHGCCQIEFCLTPGLRRTTSDVQNCQRRGCIFFGLVLAGLALIEEEVKEVSFELERDELWWVAGVVERMLVHGDFPSMSFEIYRPGQSKSKRFDRDRTHDLLISCRSPPFRT